MFNLEKYFKKDPPKDTAVIVELKMVDCTFATILINNKLYFAGTVFDCCNRVLEAEQMLHKLLLSYTIKSDFKPLEERAVQVGEKKQKKEVKT